jgi:outer membrane protein assembly factor BamB
MRVRSRRTEAVLFWAGVAFLAGLPASALEKGGEKKGEKAEKAEEKKGPEHGVTLEEDETVTTLLKKAREAAVKAVKDPEAWPVSVKAYSEILAKHADKVYLYRWSGDNEEGARAYGLGVYRSVAEKVGEELAGLSPAGLAVYRAMHDSTARGMYADAQERLDEREMETVGRTYFSTTWGDDALLWLGEMAYDRGANRQAVARLARIAKHPDPSAPALAVKVRTFLAELKVGHRDEAEKLLPRIAELAKDPKAGNLRVGEAEGEAALADLRARLEAAPRQPVQTTDGGGGLDTLLGNATHTRVGPPRPAVGVRKWSESIARLLGAPKGYQERTTRMIRDPNTGQPRRVTVNNVHLTARGNCFLLTNGRVVGGHLLSNPNPDRPLFWFPSSPAGLWPTMPGATGMEQQTMGVIDSPLFCTLGEDHLYVALGPPPMDPIPRWWGGGQQPKQTPNWLAAVGKKRGGMLGLESGLLLWSLEPPKPGSETDHRVNSKADQEWLKEVYFASAPTYADGTLYVLAVESGGGSHTAWAVSLDAGSGRVLWKTKLCTGSPAYFNSGTQPALALPVAVGGGSVYCVTNLGAVAALDAATGGVKWIRVYERNPGLEADPNRGRMPSATDSWDANPPILFEDILICTPQDSLCIYAFDLQTGRRKWQAERVRDSGRGAPGDAERLRTVVGLVNRRLVLTGKGVVFMDAAGGRLECSALLSGPAVGRGVIAGEQVFVPTATGVDIVDARLVETKDKDGGVILKPTAKLLAGQKWTDPQLEAGNLFLASDVLLSVSPTHVNAYFIPEAIEARLKERLKTAPDDLATWAELGDLYHVLGRFEDAVAAFDEGLARPAAKSDEPKLKEQAAELRARKFEAFFAAGEKALPTDPAAATKRYEQALATAQKPEQSVRAVWKMAEAALARKEGAQAVEHYQRLILEFSGVNYSFEPNSSCLASVFAHREIEKLKKSNRQALEQYERRAREAIQAALEKKDLPGLEAALRRFPSADAQADGLLALTQLALEKNEPGLARTYGQRFLSVGRSSPRLPEALACLALAYEKCGMLGAAKNTLRGLARDPALGEASLKLPDGQTQKAGAWANARLAEPVFQKPASNAARSLGDGKLVEAWTKGNLAVAAALNPAGQPPSSMLRTALTVEQANELVARSGHTGEELWLPRPKLPADCYGQQSAWADELLVLAGASEVLALDTRQKGKVAWTYTIGAAEAASGQPEVDENEAPVQVRSVPGRGGSVTLVVSEQLVVLGLPGGRLAVLDGSSGLPVWSAKGEGGQILGAPAVGNGFVAVANAHQRPPRIAVYDLASGQRRAQVNFPAQQLLQPPVACGDQLYLAGNDQKLRAYSAADGKQLWEHALNGPPAAVTATPELVLCVTANLELVALDPNAAGNEKRLLWRAQTDTGGQCAGVIMDGEDVFLASRQDARRGQLLAFQAKGGKLKWKVETGGEAISAETSLARDHLLLGSGSPDRGRGASTAQLVHRVSGKLTWVQNYTAVRVGGTVLGDGGVLLCEENKVTAFLPAASETVAQDLEGLQKQLRSNPGDAALRLRLAQILFDRGEGRKAVETLSPALALQTLDAAAFSQGYRKLARFREAVSRTSKPVLTFSRLRSPPKMDGDLSEWQKLPAATLDTWRDVYLAGEEEARLPYGASAWKGPADLSVAFRGAYDEKNLYLSWVVTDDVHSNTQTEPVELWQGDSVQVAFDLEQDAGPGFRGNDFEMGLALNDKGELLRCRWVEKGRFVMKPLEAEGKVIRGEDQKQTLYFLTLPLDYLGLKPGAGTKFGFTFIVNDSDGPKGIEKGMAPSPGIWDPKFPGQYATGEWGD